ncbi:MAG: cadherin-like domain-containing protein, partial [Methylococcales bacterium]|nr:cadherin-like domain-containing protein [Methylococcales bacterium]
MTYTPDTDYSGPDGFSFTVSDGEDTSLPAAVSITVSEPIVPANAVPVASAVGPITTAYNAAVPITLEGTDNDEGDTLAFSASSPSHGSLTPLSGASGSLVTYTPNTDYSGSDSFSFTVSDGKDTSAPVTVSITVSPPANTPPTAAFTASPPSGDAPLIVTFTNSSEDSDGTIEAYQWDFGDGSSFSTEQNPTHTYAEANPNPYTVTLTVTDNGGLPDSASASVTVTAASPPPVAVASAPSEVAEATVVTLDGSKSTGEGSLTYEWTQDSADAAKVTLKQKPDDTSATFTAPKVGLASIDLRFTLKVTDSKGLNSQATVTVRVNNNPALNSIPVADAGPGISIEQGNEVTLLGENSSDADGDETIVNYTWSQHPEDPVRVTLVNDP